MSVNICIVHYNTPLLTSALVRSINKFTPNSKIYIFDNSDKNPFTEKFDNVEIIDNTKGQVVNFDKWLQKYPNRNTSPGKANKWGSAKHCYSVEKCMEIIKDNFILLDSDVLLKKDISPICDEKYICAGEIMTQPRSTIKRVVPYIMYVNNKMCKEHNVHYFDEKHMHGLAFKGGDMYDTGAGFYLQIKKYPFKEIKCYEYVEHFKGGSWTNSTAYKQKHIQNLSDSQWLQINKYLWSENAEMNKRVVYTCITGNYDDLKSLTKFDDTFDYVCFTDNENITSNFWQIRPIPAELSSLPKVKQQRCIKINAHKYLPEYEFSVWIDGIIDIKGDLSKFVAEKCSDETANVFIPSHPQRKCIYKEAEACIKLKKDTAENINKQINRYKKEGFPANYGLVQTNIMFRRHNSPDCIRLMETWWNELKNESHRDQLSFNYALWKNQDVKLVCLDKTTCNSDYFTWGKFHAGKKKNATGASNGTANAGSTNKNNASKTSVTKSGAENRSTAARYNTYENEYTKFNSNATKVRVTKQELRQKYEMTGKQPATKSLRAFLGL